MPAADVDSAQQGDVPVVCCAESTWAAGARGAGSFFRVFAIGGA
jgi:hypothetical protein